MINPFRNAQVMSPAEIDARIRIILVQHEMRQEPTQCEVITGNRVQYTGSVVYEPGKVGLMVECSGHDNPRHSHDNPRHSHDILWVTPLCVEMVKKQLGTPPYIKVNHGAQFTIGGHDSEEFRND